MLKGLTINFVFNDAFCLFVFPVHVFIFLQCCFPVSISTFFVCFVFCSVLYFNRLLFSFFIPYHMASMSSLIQLVFVFICCCSPPVSRSSFLYSCHFYFPRFASTILPSLLLLLLLLFLYSLILVLFVCCLVLTDFYSSPKTTALTTGTIFHCSLSYLFTSSPSIPLIPFFISLLTYHFTRPSSVKGFRFSPLLCSSNG